MSIPTLKQVRTDQFIRELWKICPLCHGGRGVLAKITVTDESGATDVVFKTVTCSLCAGNKVVPKFPDQQ